MKTKKSSTRDEGCILFVDDDASIRESLGDLLTTCGFEVLVAHSYNSAVKVLETTKQEIETILCDIKMPGKSGVEVLRYVNEHDLNVPVIFLTGVATLETCRDAVKDGALEYLLKPVDEKDQLVFSLRHGVDMYRCRKEQSQMQADVVKMAEDQCDILENLISHPKAKNIVMERIDDIIRKSKKC